MIYPGTWRLWYRVWFHSQDMLVDLATQLGAWTWYGVSNCVVILKTFWINILIEQLINICKKCESKSLNTILFSTSYWTLWWRGNNLQNLSVSSYYITAALLPVSLAFGLALNVASFIPSFWSHNQDIFIYSSTWLGDRPISRNSYCFGIWKVFLKKIHQHL